MSQISIQLVDQLKEITLEYALKIRDDDFVLTLAKDQFKKFSCYDLIPMSLFKWYQVHLIIKNHDYEKFENAVGILIVLFEKFPNVLNTFEFLRIIRKLKTIAVLNKLKRNKEEAFELLQEYFPQSNILQKNEIDIRITLQKIMLSSQFKETSRKILSEFNEKEHASFFQAFSKILDKILKKIVQTKLDKIIDNRFQNAELTLFGEGYENLPTRDKIYCNFIIDKMLDNLYNKRRLLENVDQFLLFPESMNETANESSSNETFARGLLDVSFLSDERQSKRMRFEN